jgi:hypothetical protein
VLVLSYRRPFRRENRSAGLRRVKKAERSAAGKEVMGDTTFAFRPCFRGLVRRLDGE